MKILITGASGNIGRHLVAALASGHDLVLTSRDTRYSYPGTRRVRLDLAQAGQLAALICEEKPDAIIHLAALLGEACEADPDLARSLNVDAVLEMASSAKENGTKKIIFASTAAVYEQVKFKPTPEDRNIAPRGVYGTTKLEAEHVLQETLKDSDMSLIILRPFNVYGPGMEESLVYRLTHSTASQPARLKGFGRYYRDYVHIDDVVTAFEAALSLGKAGAQIINVGSGEALNNEQLVEVLRFQGHKPYYEIEGDITTISWADISRAKSLLGFEPARPLKLSP